MDHEPKPDERPRTIEGLMNPIPSDELLRRARAIIKRMCNGDHRWVMTIPVQDDDSDIVLGEVCRRLTAAQEQLGQAAMLIHVAGPLPHRIRMLQADHARTFDKMEARLQALLRERVAYLRALVQEGADVTCRVTTRLIEIRDEMTTELADVVATLAARQEDS
jgi:hypothetical protein